MNFEQALNCRKPDILLQTIDKILLKIDEDITDLQLESIVNDLFPQPPESAQTLTVFLKEVFIENSFSDVVCKSLVLLQRLVDNHCKIKSNLFIKETVHLCLDIICSACTAKIKEKCFLPLHSVVNGQLSEFILRITDVLVKHISKRNEKPSILAKECELIGVICKLYPEFINDNSESVGKGFLLILEEHVQDTIKIPQQLIEGCLNGLDNYLYNFFSPHMGNTLYKGVKRIAGFDEQYRRGHSRAALQIVCHHGKLIRTYLYEDYLYWHKLLLCWIKLTNPDDKKIGSAALFSYYENIGDFLSDKVYDEVSPCLNYFMSYFKNILSEKFEIDPDTNEMLHSYEVKYALKGFTVFISKCRAFLNAEEFYDISKTIKEKALLNYQESSQEGFSVLKSATSQTTEKIEELCDYVEALAIMEINMNHDLESLVYILISDYPKCRIHRQYIVINAIEKTLKVVDIQLVVQQLIKESCKYCISTELFSDYKEDSTNLTYAVFMSLWKGILKSQKNYNSAKVFHEFIIVILKTLPTLNLHTKIVPTQVKDNVEEFHSHLESFEIPVFPSDYRLFINMCDLTTSTMSFIWTYEWSLKWINNLILMILKGRKDFMSATGYLKIMEQILKIINYSSYEINKEVERNILEVLNDLSVIQGNGLFQLRSALVILQTPIILLNNYLIIKACDAFKIVLRMGKCHTVLIYDALEILDSWYDALPKETFIPVCNEVIHILSDYLSATDVSTKNEFFLNNTKGNVINIKQTTDKQNLTRIGTLHHRIMLFFGKLDPSLLSCLKRNVPTITLNEDEEDNSIYKKEILKIPFLSLENKSFDIYLDSLIPHIIELSLKNNNKVTRLTACQILHSIILLTLGTYTNVSNTQKKKLNTLLVKLNTTVLHLAADSDNNVSQMFTPLLKQLCHWFSITNDLISNEETLFLSVLLKGAAHSSDNMIHELSCQVLKEYIYWHIKMCNSLEISPNITFILRSLCRMMSYSDENEQYGAYLILVHVSGYICSSDSIIDTFLLELLHNIVTSIDQHYKYKTFIISNTAHINCSLQALQKSLNCLEEKIYIFKESSQKRIVPSSFSNGCLDGISLWLLSKTKCFCRPLAKMCMQSFVTLSKLHDFDTPGDYVLKLLPDPQYFIKTYIEYENIQNNYKEMKNVILFTEYLKEIYSSVDSYIFIFEHNFFDFHKIIVIFQKLNIFASIEHILCLINNDCINTIYDELMQEQKKSIIEDGMKKVFNISQKYVLEDMIFHILWKSYELIYYFSQFSLISNSIKVLESEVSKSLISWVFDPKKILILHRNHHTQEKRLKEIISEFSFNIWPEFENIFIFELKKSQLQNLLSDPESNDITNKNCLLISLEYVSDILEVVDSKIKSEIISEFQVRNIEHNIFDYLFIERNNTIYVRNLCSYFDESLSAILTFIHKNELIDIKVYLNILCDNKTVYEEEGISSRKTKMRGKYILYKFEDIIVPYIMKNIKATFTYVQENIDENNCHIYATFIENLCQLLFGKMENKEIDNIFVQNFISMLNKLWSEFIKWNVTFECLIKIFSYLPIIFGSQTKLLTNNENNLIRWLLKSLINNSISFENQVSLIILLPTILQPGVNEDLNNPLIKESLDNFKNHFPTSCYEFNAFSKRKSTYIDSVKSILDAMVSSGSYVLLEFIIKITIGDRNHICENDISSMLKLFMGRLNDEEQSKVASQLFEMMKTTKLGADSFLNFTNRFLIPLISLLRQNLLDESLSECVSFFLDVIRKDISITLSKYQLQRTLVEQITVYKLMEVMFLKLSLDRIDGEHSKIAEKLNSENLPAKQFMKIIFSKTISTRKLKLPTDTNFLESREYLRLLHCAAYKCAYAITISKPKADIKLYAFLLNDKSNNSEIMWEGMIDCTKIYVFPIYVSQIPKEKQLLIPIGKRNVTQNSNRIFLENSLNILLSKSDELVSNNIYDNQSLYNTLIQSTLKYDLNTSAIRQATNISSNFSFFLDNTSHSVLIVDDNDDFNNHECMPTVCQIIKNISEISIDSNSENHENKTPDWIIWITNIFNDKNKHMNIKLFFSQIIINMHNIFKNYGKAIFLPILLNIQERYKNYKKFNYHDICILSLLMSWKIKAESEDETHVISSILCYLIVEIINTTKTDVLKHYFELLQTFLSIWGQQITIQQEILFNEYKFESANVKKYLQIIEIFFLNEICPWNENNFTLYCEFVLKHLEEKSGNYYKQASEIIGLSLKLLNRKSEFKPVITEDKLYQKFIKEVKSVLNAIFQKNEYNTFVLGYHNIQKHSSALLEESLISKLLQIYNKISNEIKKLCLVIFYHASDKIEKEALFEILSNLQKDCLITDKVFQIRVLNIINKTLDLNNISNADKIIIVKDYSLVSQLSTNYDKNCREIAYEILIKLYKLNYKYFGPEIKKKTFFVTSDKIASKRSLEEENIHTNIQNFHTYDEPAKSNMTCLTHALLNGLDDNDIDLKNAITNFWAKQYSHNIYDRWIKLCFDFLNGLDSNTLNLGKFLKALFAMSFIDDNFGKQELFKNPLEDCNQVEYNLNIGNKQRFNLPTPVFAETLNSQLMISNILEKKQSGKVLKKRDLINLQSIITTYNKPFLKSEESFLKQTLSSFNSTLIDDDSLNNEKNMKSSEILKQEFGEDFGSISGPSNVNENDIFQRFKKKILVNKRQQIINYTGFSKKKSKMIGSEKVKENIRSLKCFKDGDYPDIQIKLIDVISPLFELLECDIITKDLFIAVYKSLCGHLPENRTKQTENFIDSEYIENFKINALKIIINFLKSSDLTVESTVIMALLQICQLSISASNTIENFNDVIINVSKKHRLEWLGHLIVEEKEIYFFNKIIHKPKRSKFKVCDVNNSIFSNEFDDNIHQYEVIGNWVEIQKLYIKAATDEKNEDSIKLYFTKEYYDCFARLSNWNDFIDQLSTECSNDENIIPFDYNCLWEKRSMRSTLLPLIFKMNVHKLNDLSILDGYSVAENINQEESLKCLQYFDSCIDHWEDHKRKKKYLNSDLLPYLATWKAVYMPNKNSLNYINSSLELLRNKWIHENALQIYKTNSLHILSNDRNVSIMSEMLLMSEIAYILNSPMFSTNTSQSFDVIDLWIKKFLKVWKNCVSSVSDDLLVWDLRLTCRSIFTHYIQQTLKSANIESEDTENAQILINQLNKTQRIAELAFVNSAVTQLNPWLAEKYVIKHSQYLDDDEQLDWGFQWAKINKLKIAYNGNVKNKLYSLLNAWKLGEDIRLSYNTDINPVSIIHLLSHSSYISYDVLAILRNNDGQINDLDRVEIHKCITDIFRMNTLFTFEPKYNVEDCDVINTGLVKYSYTNLNECVKIVEKYINFNTVKEISESTVSNSYLEMAKFCRKVDDEIEEFQNSNILSDLTLCLLKAIKYGNTEARKLFPILLVKLQNAQNGDASEKFESEIKDIPCWLFLPWISQLLAYLPNLKCTIFPLIMTIASEYPQSMIYNYRLSKQTWKYINDCQNLEYFVSRLDAVLLNSNVEMLIKALSFVCDPYILLKNKLEDILKISDEENSLKWNSAFKDLFDEIYPNEKLNSLHTLRGSIFNQLNKYKSTLEDIWRTSSDSNKNINHGKELIREFMTTVKPQNFVDRDIRSISDFSPYLSNYGENNTYLLELFGQYGEFDSFKPIPTKHITIAKFGHSVNYMINSQRKPIRLTIYGSNGKKYFFLLKRGEDLRQDERIQQLLKLMNFYLHECNMKIHTYKVIPLSWDMGMIQWLINCVTLEEILIQFESGMKDLLCHLKIEMHKHVLNVPGSTLEEKYFNMTQDINESKLQYNKMTAKIPKYILRNALYKLATSPEKFIYIRNNYIESLASMNMAHWLLGIGDRHMSNCMLNVRDGNLISIDYECVFGMATQLLKIPELLPFRLTSQLLNVIAYYTLKGKFRYLMIKCLENLKQNSAALLAAMEVFVYEPSMNWIHQSYNKAHTINEDNTIQHIQQNESIPRMKINQCRKKLLGVVPFEIILEDLKYNVNLKKEFIDSLFSIVTTSCDKHTKEERLTAPQQVDCLLALATNSNVYSITYYGWEPWL